MNLIGKIFIVLIFVMSLVFMAFAVAVYHTHQNWRAVVERRPEDTKPGYDIGLKYKLQNALQEYQELKDKYEKINGEEKAKVKLRDDSIASLKAENETLKTKLASETEDKDKLKKTNDEQVATLTTEGQNLKALTAEVEGLRKEIRLAQSERDKSFKNVVALTDNLVDVQGRLTTLKARSVELSAAIAAQKKVLESVGLTKDSNTGDPPPRMRGKVLAVNAEKMVEISLGSDDGLREGHTLEIFRGNKYLGRVEVLSITFNRAVAKIVPGYQQGVIQKGDDVATGLNKVS